MRRRGFTIVELVIVITIMAILLTLGVVNLRSAQANARDTERKTDIESIAQHLETYYTSGTDSSTVSSCTGGTITRDGLFTVHTFTASGSLTCTGTISGATVLVVAGGGGGHDNLSGGGGGGGVLTGSQTLTGTMAVTVGDGGLGAYAMGTTTNGNNSIFGTYTAIGGGRGGSRDTGLVAGSGGSGGGGGSGATNSGGNGTGGQGYSGGAGTVELSTSSAGGGGGGAGGAGETATSQRGGDGGVGILSNITGTNTFYGGGGGGHSGYYMGVGGIGGGGNAGWPGVANTGGGGAGSANGGSGVVIIRYATPTTSNTYPSTSLTTNLSSMTAALRDIDTDSLMAPGINDPTQTFISATNATQTIAGVLPQPTINQYVYQPLDIYGLLCNGSTECTKFNLYYRTEVDNTVQMVSSVDQ